jgi:NAD(P)-dependent dehydrogenase (short-subunit alcohol dehydrogenase family)
MSMRLQDKIAIVTGGGSGIGRGVSVAYAHEGATVVVADIDLDTAQETVAQIEAEGGKGRAVRCDVADPAQIAALIETAKSAYGRIDILFNGAGIISNKPLLETTIEEWDRILTVNLRGEFLCLQAAAKVMVEQGRGKIINITSVLAAQARINRAPYGAAKAGIVALTQSAAIELGPKGVFVNAIAPGSIQTGMTKGAPPTPEAAARKLAGIPVRRLGVPEDLTGPAIFLASDESDYVSGVVLTVDGGFLASVDR